MLARGSGHDVYQTPVKMVVTLLNQRGRQVKCTTQWGPLEVVVDLEPVIERLAGEDGKVNFAKQLCSKLGIVLMCTRASPRLYLARPATISSARKGQLTGRADGIHEALSLSVHLTFTPPSAEGGSTGTTFLPCVTYPLFHASFIKYLLSSASAWAVPAVSATASRFFGTTI